MYNLLSIYVKNFVMSLAFRDFHKLVHTVYRSEPVRMQNAVLTNICAAQVMLALIMASLLDTIKLVASPGIGHKRKSLFRACKKLPVVCESLQNRA